MGTGIIVAVAAAAVVSVTMLIAGTIYIYRRFCKNQGVVSFEIQQEKWNEEIKYEKPLIRLI